MRKEQFREYIACYGPDISLWPEPLVEKARVCLVRYPDLQEDLDIEQELASLLKAQYVEPHSDDLAARIIAQAIPKPEKEHQGRWDWLLSLFCPSPAYALTLVVALVVGFTFGYTGVLRHQITDDSDDVTMNEFLYYDGELL